MRILLLSCALALAILACSAPEKRIPVIIDTDANNELDDQHALAYLFFNSKIFDIKGVTTNATYNGGTIDEHLLEAQRVMQLCNVSEKYPLLKGADQNFQAILPELDSGDFDGEEAVSFIVEQALNQKNGKLVLVPIGKLTNIALAIKKEPKIADKIRIVWLGSNHPKPGEYNLDNDYEAANYLLSQDVEFEMVMVRYGEASGSDAVRVTPEEIRQKLKGAGPSVAPVEGRHGGGFTNFGDYSLDLFSKIDLHGDPPSRALFDVVALAILKNPAWGERKSIPAPELVDGTWQARPGNKRELVIWENFDKQAILDDFFMTMKHAKR